MHTISRDVPVLYCPQLLDEVSGGDHPAQLAQFLGLFAEEAWPSAQSMVGATCTVEKLVTGEPQDTWRVSIEDIRGNHQSPSKDHTMGRQRQRRWPFGPYFIVGALQAFAASGMLGVRSVTLLNKVSSDDAG